MDFGEGGKSLSPERSFLPQFLLLFTHAFPRPRETAQLGPEGIDAAHVLGGNGKGHDAVEQTAPLLLALAAFDLRALVGLGQDGQKRNTVPTREVREITVQCLRRNPAVEQQG